MISATLRQASLVALAALACSSSASAHGLLLSATGEPNAIVGRVSYSDGAPGAGEFVELRDLETPSAPPSTRAADRSGAFRFPATMGHRYALTAYGEEGHTTELRLTLAPGARGRMIDDPPSSADIIATGDAPAWMMVGGLIVILALIVGGWEILSRRRER